MNTKKVYFKNLDSIRFFAALIVVHAHCIAPCYDYLDVKNVFLKRFISVFSNGQTGVAIFFVLSGFLITYIILSEIEVSGSFSIKNFYIRRVFRIWPLYYAVVMFSFLVYPFIKNLFGFETSPASRPFFFFTFLSNFDVINIEKYHLGHEELMQNVTWSVSVEEQFYAFWPLIFAFLPKRFFVFAMTLVVISSIIFRYYIYPDGFTMTFHTLSVLGDLAIGGLFAYCIIKYQNVRTYFENIKTPVILASFVIFVFSLLYAKELFPERAGLAFSRLYFALLFGFIIASQSMIKTRSRLQLGNIRFANNMGKYTYGIYLLHPIAFLFVVQAFRYFHIAANSFKISLVIGIMSSVVGVLLSMLSYTYLEKPFLRLKERFSVIVKGQ